jgi:hypothetical protein
MLTRVNLNIGPQFAIGESGPLQLGGRIGIGFH